jgi:hypothetical protein
MDRWMGGGGGVGGGRGGGGRAGGQEVEQKLLQLYDLDDGAIDRLLNFLSFLWP